MKKSRLSQGRPVSSYNNDYHRQWDAAERASHTMEDEDVKLFIKAVKFYDKMERINRKMQRLNKKYSDNNEPAEDKQGKPLPHFLAGRTMFHG